MKQKNRLLAGLLAVALMLTLVPSAFAAQGFCPTCGSPNCTCTVIKEANCHEEGVEEYICRNETCPQYQQSQLRKLDRNPDYHDAIYTDNGDGTHSGVCSHHAVPVTVQRERHTYSNGLCTKCRAVDYSSVNISLPENPVVYAALDDTSAVLSLSGVSLSIGSADITADYDFSYNWYYQGKLVGSDKTYTLPADITAKEGSYKYVCFVMAVPKNSLTTQPVSGSCTVTARVQDLITAYAAVGRGDKYLYLGDRDDQSSQSVEEQIYEAVYSASDSHPDYVIFNSTTSSTKAGTLDVIAGERRYYFDPSTANQYALKDVAFRPSGDATGTYTTGFSAYDTRGKEYAGVLTITVGQSAGDMDVLYTTSRDTALKLSAASFEDFWLDAYNRGSLTWVRFTQLPSAAEGSLYVDYESAARPGTRIRSGDTFYRDPGRNQYGISEVTFVAGGRQSDYVVVPFEAYGENNAGRQIYLDGSMYILVSDGKAADITCRVSAGSTYALNEADFLSVYQSATGSRGSGFSIQLSGVPANGSLYVGYTAAGRGTKLTAANVAGRPFYYSGTRGDLIRDLTYVPGSSLTDTVSYLAYDSQGKLLYSGKIVFTVGELAVSYTSPATGVNFRGSDFEKLLGATGKLSTVSFTPPAAAYGTLYYGRSGASAGTAITSDSVWYSVSATNTGVNALSMDNVTFVPRTGFSGTVDIPFTAYDAGNSKVTGTVHISVTAPVAPDPGTTTNPGTDPNTKPVYTVSFPDVPNTTGNAWYYTAVMDLAQAGVIGGRSDGKFYPNDAVTYGEALKMIMLAAGYTEQAPTGKHWASGYMSRAVTDKLLPKSVDPDRKISRYTITEVAAKALHLPVSAVQTSPFADMAVSEASAPYVMALYTAGIVNGSKDETGKVNFKGTYAIRRSEMSVIIWRINNYNRTGNAAG